jgi:antibiotic biosynthesis monooxygenase (ABM) superfamily enzyme
MARYKMLVLSRPTPGHEERYNDWYQNTHLAQIVSLPGFISAQRFKVAVNMRGDDCYPYAAIYEIEADDLDAVYKTLEAAASDGTISVSAAFDYETVYASIYEPLGDTVSTKR